MEELSLHQSFFEVLISLISCLGIFISLILWNPFYSTIQNRIPFRKYPLIFLMRKAAAVCQKKSTFRSILAFLILKIYRRLIWHFILEVCPLTYGILRHLMILTMDNMSIIVTKFTRIKLLVDAIFSKSTYL